MVIYFVLFMLKMDLVYVEAGEVILIDAMIMNE